MRTSSETSPGVTLTNVAPINYSKGREQVSEIKSTHWDGCWKEGHYKCALARLERLESELADIKAAHREIMQEPCDENLRHCTCVPALRQANTNLQNRNAELVKALEEAEKSLRSIERNIFHKDGSLYDRLQVAGYANSRATVAEALLEREKGQSDNYAEETRYTEGVCVNCNFKSSFIKNGLCVPCRNRWNRERTEQ